MTKGISQWAHPTKRMLRRLPALKGGRAILSDENETRGRGDDETVRMIQALRAKRKCDTSPWDNVSHRVGGANCPVEREMA